MSSGNLLVIAELRNGKLRDQTLECIGKAIEMNEKYNFKVSCVVLGHLIKGVIEELSEYVDAVYFVDDKNFALYNSRRSSWWSEVHRGEGEDSRAPRDKDQLRGNTL